ncbi:MAG TPA: DUF192 domain-containing protein [Gaiellaceae bacterium]|jgi:hypothetical protein
MRRRALVAALLLAASGCGGETGDAPTVSLVSGDRTTTVAVEVADDAGERSRGLSNRDSLEADAGMLFLFPGASTATFWMKDTRIPLSIAFFDRGGRILAVRDMTPCPAEPCRTYRSPSPYVGALEVNRGAFGRWHVAPGDRVRLGDGIDPANAS